VFIADMWMVIPTTTNNLGNSTQLIVEIVVPVVVGVLLIAIVMTVVWWRSRMHKLAEVERPLDVNFETQATQADELNNLQLERVIGTGINHCFMLI
jgi:hypothetical protein